MDLLLLIAIVLSAGVILVLETWKIGSPRTRKTVAGTTLLILVLLIVIAIVQRQAQRAELRRELEQLGRIETVEPSDADDGGEAPDGEAGD